MKRTYLDVSRDFENSQLAMKRLLNASPENAKRSRSKTSPDLDFFIPVYQIPEIVRTIIGHVLGRDRLFAHFLIGGTDENTRSSFYRMTLVSKTFLSVSLSHYRYVTSNLTHASEEAARNYLRGVFGRFTNVKRLVFTEAKRAFFHPVVRENVHKTSTSWMRLVSEYPKDFLKGKRISFNSPCSDDVDRLPKLSSLSPLRLDLTYWRRCGQLDLSMFSSLSALNLIGVESHFMVKLPPSLKSLTVRQSTVFERGIVFSNVENLEELTVCKYYAGFLAAAPGTSSVNSSYFGKLKKFTIRGPTGFPWPSTHVEGKLEEDTSGGDPKKPRLVSYSLSVPGYKGNTDVIAAGEGEEDSSAIEPEFVMKERYFKKWQSEISGPLLLSSIYKMEKLAEYFPSTDYYQHKGRLTPLHAWCNGGGKFPSRLDRPEKYLELKELYGDVKAFVFGALNDK